MPREPFDPTTLDAPPIDDGGPAFPGMTEREQLSKNDHYITVREPEGGMSLRQWYAGKALFAVLYARTVVGLETDENSIADACFKLADALIRRGKP